jgi:hypothetical protein
MEPAIMREPRYLDEAEREGGRCPVCSEAARLLTCWECLDSSWTIDCGHRPAPPPMRWGRADGTDPHRVFCVDCADR